MNFSEPEPPSVVASFVDSPDFILKLKFRDLPGFALSLHAYSLFKYPDGRYELQAVVPESIEEIREGVEYMATAYHREKMLAVLQARVRSLEETRELHEWFKEPFKL